MPPAAGRTAQNKLAAIVPARREGRRAGTPEAKAEWQAAREHEAASVSMPEGGWQAAVEVAAAGSGSPEEPRKAAQVVMSFERPENSGPTNRTTP